MAKAYYISGHGNGATRDFIVPPGCTVVVMARAGELTCGSMRSEFCELPAHIFQQPNSSTNRALLLDAFGGSLAFYEAGDRCPDFNYYFPACFGIDDADYKCSWVG
jgi:hypothetical protein